MSTKAVLAKAIIAKAGATILKNMKKYGEFEGELAGGIGAALALTALVSAMVADREEEVRDAARVKLNCEHIQLCKGSVGSGQTTGMIEYVSEKHGMAFVYHGIALCHAQANFDSGKSSAHVFRWEDGAVIKGTGKKGVHKCRICSKKDTKVT